MKSVRMKLDQLYNQFFPYCTKNCLCVSTALNSCFEFTSNSEFELKIIDRIILYDIAAWKLILLSLILIGHRQSAMYIVWGRFCVMIVEKHASYAFPCFAQKGTNWTHVCQRRLIYEPSTSIYLPSNLTNTPLTSSDSKKTYRVCRDWAVCSLLY